MTHEEIEATIKRIQEYDEDGCKNAAHAVIAFMDGERHREFQDKLISLLRQADPKTHIELPKGADGEAINVGDLIYEEGDEPFWVDEMMVNKAKGWEIFGGGYGEGFSAYDPATCRHYHKPTVEDVLREFGDEVQRCCDTEDTIAEYAAKLRELMADDDD